MIIKGEAKNYPQILKLNKFLIGHKGYIAGGCFKNIFNNESAKDIDIFFEKEKDFLEAENYYKKQIEKEPQNWKFSYENKNCWAVYSVKDKVQLELIRADFHKPELMLEQFDFTITKFAYTTKYDEKEDRISYTVYFHQNFFEHLLRKLLVVDDKLTFPLSSFNRMIRYVQYGYTPCRETKLKFVKEISKLSFEDDNMLDASFGKAFYEGFY